MENDTTAKKVCRRILYGLGYTVLGGLLVAAFILLPMYTESLGFIGKWWHGTLTQLGAITGFVLLALLASFIYHWAWGPKTEDK